MLNEKGSEAILFLLFLSFQEVSCFISLRTNPIRCYEARKLTMLDQVTYSHSKDVYECLAQTDFNVIRSASAGALAGGMRALSRGLTFPFDSMKTFEQAKGQETKSRTLAQYFKGVTPTVLSAVPANALFFVTYEYLLSSLPCLDPTANPTHLLIARLIISAIATLPQNALKIPAELIKQRAQIQSESNFRKLITQATAREGVLGLYRGGGAQLLREIPYNSIQMASYAFLQDYCVKNPISIPIPNHALLLSSGALAALLGLLSAALASILTQPADVVKTRIMTDLDEEDTIPTSPVVNINCENSGVINSNDESRWIALDDTSSILNGTSDVTAEDSSSLSLWVMNITVIRHCIEIVREEGFSGLFAGLVPRLLLVSVGGMVYFWAADITESYFKHM